MELDVNWRRVFHWVKNAGVLLKLFYCSSPLLTIIGIMRPTADVTILLMLVGLIGCLTIFSCDLLDWSGVNLALNPLYPASKLFYSKSSLELQYIYILKIEKLNVNITL